MSILEIILISVGLAMDAFAVSVCKGLAMKKMYWNKAIIIGLYFGIFQSLMPLIGFLLGDTFDNFIRKIDHWIAFIILSIIGLNMIKDIFNNNDESKNDNITFKTMILLSIATSIDALTVGITFAFFDVNIPLSIIFIGIIAFLFSVIGVKIGNKYGSKYEKKAELIGGIILISMGLKILLEHLEIL